MFTLRPDHHSLRHPIFVISLVTLFLSLLAPALASPAAARYDLLHAQGSSTAHYGVSSQTTVDWASPIAEMNVYGCPAGYDPSIPKPANKIPDCTEAVGPVDFTVYSNEVGAQSYTTSGTYPKNHVEFSHGLDFEDDQNAENAGDGLPVALVASMPPGYGSVTVWCSYWEYFAPTPVQIWGPSIMPKFGTAIQIAVGAGYTMSCDWFFVQNAFQITDSSQIQTQIDVTDDASIGRMVPGGSVRIFKHTCPEGVAPSEADMLLSEQCREQAAPVEFTVSNQQGYTETQAVSGGVPLSTEFTGVPYGVISITEAIPSGYGQPLVFCSGGAGEGAGEYEPVEVVNGNTINWNLAEDTQGPLSCAFYNMPADNSIGQVERGQMVPSDEIPQAVVTIPARVDNDLIPIEPVGDEEHPPDPIMPGTLFLAAVTCTADVRFEEVSAEALAHGCTEPAEGIVIDVVVGDDRVSSGPTGANGEVQLKVPTGKFTLQGHLTFIPDDQRLLACEQFPEWERGDDVIDFKATEFDSQPWQLSLESGLIHCKLYLGTSASEGSAAASRDVA